VDAQHCGGREGGEYEIEYLKFNEEARSGTDSAGLDGDQFELEVIAAALVQRLGAVAVSPHQDALVQIDLIMRS
jgi:hypothetical protein